MERIKEPIKRRRKPIAISTTVHFLANWLLGEAMSEVLKGLGITLSGIGEWWLTHPIWSTFVFLMVVIIVVILADNFGGGTSSPEVSGEARSKGQSGGVTAGNWFGNLVQNIFPPAEKPQPQYIPPVAPIDDIQTEGVYIRKTEAEFDEFDIEKYFTFTVHNDSGENLRNCFVILEEIEYRSRRKKQGKWKSDNVVVTDKPFRWKHRMVNSDGKLFDVKKGDRVSFDLGGHWQEKIMRLPTYELIRFYFTFYEEREEGLKKPRMNYRLLISFRAYYGLDNLVRVNYVVYLDEKSKGIYEFNRLERMAYD